jgi:DNA-binding transcriptional LysR family regulator
MALDLHRLELFVAIASELNVTRAAAQLHLTQQALSSSLREFERQLGVPLFVRTGRRLRLTSAGQQLLNDAAALLAASEQVVERTRRAVNDLPRSLATA